MYLFSLEYIVLVIAFLIVVLKMLKVRRKDSNPDRIDLFSKS